MTVKPIVGRILGFDPLTFESAAEDQGLRRIGTSPAPTSATSRSSAWSRSSVCAAREPRYRCPRSPVPSGGWSPRTTCARSDLALPGAYEVMSGAGQAAGRAIVFAASSRTRRTWASATPGPSATGWSSLRPGRFCLRPPVTCATSGSARTSARVDPRAGRRRGGGHRRCSTGPELRHRRGLGGDRRGRTPARAPLHPCLHCDDGAWRCAAAPTCWPTSSRSRLPGRPPRIRGARRPDLPLDPMTEPIMETIRPVAADEWTMVAWLWQAFRSDLAPIVQGLPYADGRYAHGPLDAYPAQDRVGYLAWRPHPDTGAEAPVGFALVSGLDGERRHLDHFWTAPAARRGGLGLSLATYVVDRHPGPWRSRSSTTTPPRPASGGEWPRTSSAPRGRPGPSSAGRCRASRRCRPTTG